jgi:hypothetical protein
LEDIEGAKGKKVYVRTTQYDSFNYADITKTKFVSTRTVDPLKPNYSVRDDKGNICVIGEIPGSFPKKNPERKTGGFFDGLEIKDIPGTAVGSKRMGNFHSLSRRHFTATNLIQDIPGA